MQIVRPCHLVTSRRRPILTYQLFNRGDGLGHGGGVVLRDFPVAVDAAVHKAVAGLDLQAWWGGVRRQQIV
jgi:hypothetical protein